ncbi:MULTISPECIES: hypothetical protein [unclassified Mesorhizobium]|uniref:hypothetical protein n=1 Tax=unclassified Mesorhizobium TaxID=325217 RepID=UPI000BCF44B6|nr:MULTISPECIES: hypothetical protein [unclassified Mesorhizobium]TGT57470.1 hypothetical protein EN813_039280 [Mesorhizobium sp. M00.F.Ca.ET.170.01.1.1]TGU42251.1 hypothetical protein EN789_33595 [bacterium M00.F.Ca.ET.146.01.1.1]AZO11799.1 hypothetical protein EJ074_23830 [Mesorhizobium sp. M3A.F.Ca.ET.080.04.2.1]PBB86304.1 hypothetical protein CK216_14520 [Mesorhizobium sp. WSM3876]RWB73080.1 MAG: hypothetical protein EOQ49_10140 [Mesorhizobium sp.]
MADPEEFWLSALYGRSLNKRYARDGGAISADQAHALGPTRAWRLIALATLGMRLGWRFMRRDAADPLNAS